MGYFDGRQCINCSKTNTTYDNCTKDFLCNSCGFKWQFPTEKQIELIAKIYFYLAKEEVREAYFFQGKSISDVMYDIKYTIEDKEFEREFLSSKLSKITASGFIGKYMDEFKIKSKNKPTIKMYKTIRDSKIYLGGYSRKVEKYGITIDVFNKDYEESKIDFKSAKYFISKYIAFLLEEYKKEAKFSRESRAYFRSLERQNKTYHKEGERKTYADGVCRWSESSNNWVDEKTYWRGNEMNYSYYGANKRD